MKRYKVLYFGIWGYGKAGLEGLVGLDNVEICKVFTKWNFSDPDSYLNQMYRLAAAQGLPVVNCDRSIMSRLLFEKEVLDSGRVDFMVSCCFDRIFSPGVLAFPDVMAINMHPSLLPKYWGVKPLENAMANGERESGVTLHELSKEIDAGDILLQVRHCICLEDTYAVLYERQCCLIKDLIRQFFQSPERWIAVKKPQDHSLLVEAHRLPYNIDDEDTVRDVIQKKRQWETKAP